jgi:hypothetical protein
VICRYLGWMIRSAARWGQVFRAVGDAGPADRAMSEGPMAVTLADIVFGGPTSVIRQAGAPGVGPEVAR